MTPVKSWEKVPGAEVKQRLKKLRKRPKTTQKTTVFSFFNLFWTIFQHVWTPRPRGAGNLFFLTFFGISDPKGPNDSCKGPRRLQYRILLEHLASDAVLWIKWPIAFCVKARAFVLSPRKANSRQPIGLKAGGLTCWMNSWHVCGSYLLNFCRAQANRALVKAILEGPKRL